MNSLSLPELELLRALLERLVPPDDFAGAFGAGVDDYVTRQLAGDLVSRLPAVAAGLQGLDAEARARDGVSFGVLGCDAQDAILRDIEAGRTRVAWETPPGAFLSLMVSLAAEGYYADPGNGGNRDRVSWKMVGYDPKVGRP